MTNIQPEQYEAAYRAGLEFHDGKVGVSEAVRHLADIGMKPSTASFHVRNVPHMLNGRRYERAMSAPATDDYLTWIRRDRGDAALSNALRALSLHIPYLSKGKASRCRGLRDILAKHRALLSRQSESAIVLEWKDIESEGWMDWLPLAWFASEGSLRKQQHRVAERGGEAGHAICDVFVCGRTAELDYRPYPEENTAQEVLLGVVRLHFEDEDRTAITDVEWKPADATDFITCPFDLLAPVVPPAPLYERPKEPAAKVARMVRDRPGQAAFRRKLKLVYGNRCCVSGCTIAEALEGAHIDPYVGPPSDNVRNGLLLRSDLHTLFDRYLVSIDPSTHTVHVAKRARCAGYEQLHEGRLTLPPESSHHPDPGALERHWREFQLRQ